MTIHEQPRRTLSCWLFGHRFRHGRKTGVWTLTAIGGVPVFICRCDTTWSPGRRVFRDQLTVLGRRDRIAHYDLR